MRDYKSFSICLVLSAYFIVPFFLNFPHANATKALVGGGGDGGMMPVSDGPKVTRDERWQLVSTEFGEISAVKISDGSNNGYYHLHFITMNPCSLFLPVYLHSEMLLYVNSGSGTLNWFNVEKNDHDTKLQQVTLNRGDIYTLQPESVFYIQNQQNYSYGYGYGYEAQILEIYAIFPNSETELQKQQQFDAVYTGIHDLVLGFDNEVLQATLGMPEEVIEELRGEERQPLIVEGQTEWSSSMRDVGSLGRRGIKAFLGTKNNDVFNVGNKKNKEKADNIYKAEHDVETCDGWSVTVTRKDLDVLKHTDFGVFMVNLRQGSMMGPHWNPGTDQVAIVLQGQGVVQVVCPGIASETQCQNSRFNVQEGDVFVVPKSHPMAQLSFNNDSFVFMGFMMTSKDNNPQYLGGKLSILQRLDRKVLAKSFNVRDTTLDLVLSDQREKIIYECTSCAQGGGGRQGGGGYGPRQEEHGRGGDQGERQDEQGGGGQREQQEEEEGGRRGEWQEGQGRGGQGGWQEGQGRGGQGGWEQGQERGGQGGWEQGQERGGQGGWEQGQGRGGQGGWEQGQERGGQGWEQGQERGGQGGWEQGQGRGGQGGWEEGQRGGGRQGWQEGQGGGSRGGWQEPDMGRGAAWGGGVQVY